LKLRRLAREPLVQFLAVGAAIFLLAGKLGGRRLERRIVVTNGQIDRMIDTFAKTWMRPPTPLELQGLIDAYVKDEIYYREAVKMGLDRDDEVIRRRMRMKMEFWNESAAQAREPTDAELSAFLAEHPDRFRSPERVTFEQVFLREDHGNEAADLLGRLRRGLDPAKAGDPLPLPASMDDAALDEVSRLFGEELGQRLAEAPIGAWEGPISSAYGLHLVRIRARTPAQLPALSAVRESVAREWFAARRDEANRGLYETLRKQYTVTVEARRTQETPTAGSRP
jgi:PPIC-type PPIASE domain